MGVHTRVVVALRKQALPRHLPSFDVDPAANDENHNGECAVSGARRNVQVRSKFVSVIKLITG